MIKIDFLFELKDGFVEGTKLSFKVLIVKPFINGKKLAYNGTIFNPAPFIALMKLKEGSSYVLNCPCGEPGCAGIEHPFTISLDGNNVKLSTPVEEFSEILISNKYAITLINELSEKIISISKENTVPVVLQEDEYGIIFEDEIKDYDIKLTFKEKIKEYENLIKEELEYETKRA